MNETAAATPIPYPLLDQRLTTAPDSPFAVETLRIRGIDTPCWRQSFPHLRAVFAHTAQFAERDYLVYEGERHTYAEHHRQVAAFAHAMTTGFGIRKGDRVALAMRNYPEWPMVFWASVAIGAVIVPLNAWLTGGELAYALADSGSRLLVVDAERLASLEPHLSGLTDLAATVVVRGPDALPASVHAWHDVLAEPYPTELPPCTLDPEDDAAIYYTSGTTGKPKGALLTHRNICSNQVTGVYLRARTEFRYGRTPQPPVQQMGQLISVPLFHVTGSIAMLIGSSLQGSKLVFMHRWNPEDAIRLIERERLNSFGGVPSMPLQVIESPIFRQHDTSSVMAVLFGGAPPSPELARRIKSVFPNASASNGYGLTETSGVATVNVAEDYLAKPASAGVPAPVSQIRIMDRDGSAELPMGETGEIWIRGPQVFKGYWRNPEATAKALVDDWLRTGDLGYVDGEGSLFVVDRAKDMLLRGGENIYCIEVENALHTHPDVLDVAVVGMPDPILGERVGAMVQLRAGATANAAALRAHVAERIAAFKVPERIDIVDEPLPRNANGKILKPQVKAAMGLK
ncbi:MAG: class I adenylate-forming enzyme family protein [Gammaproteobacteria bacterium]